MKTPSPNDSRNAGVMRMLALAVVVSASATSLMSCRSTLMAPSENVPVSLNVASPTPGASIPDAPVDSIHAMVPAISQLSVEVRDQTLHIRGLLKRRGHSRAPFYSPNAVGGWCMQVFLDNDPNSAPYWRGYDYVVRGVEWSRPASTFTIRQITLDPETPGGWGPSVGSAAFTQQGQRFEVAVPLAAVGGAEHGVNFCVETYATLACAACTEGMTQEWADDYFGSGGDIRQSNPLAAYSGAGSLMSLRVPRYDHSASMDTRLAPR